MLGWKLPIKNVTSQMEMVSNYEKVPMTLEDKKLETDVHFKPRFFSPYAENRRKQIEC